MAAGAVLVKTDQRRYLRFQLSLQLRYVIRSGPSGQGEVLNIGSGGLLFRCDRILPAGKLIQIVLAWPMELNGKCLLKLCIRGRILRSDRRGTAIELRKYEFRTAARSQTETPCTTSRNG